MIVLDTNVLSELMKPTPDAAVRQWLLDAREVTLATTAITLAELRAGIAVLPDGRRRTGLAAALDAALNDGAGLPVLGFEEEHAETYAALFRARRAVGRHADMADLMIAAVCLGAGAALATRNVGDFEGTPLTVVNPWQPGA